MKDLDRFTRGHVETIRKMNLIIDSINNLNTMRTDSFVIMNNTPGGITLGLNIDRVKERLAYLRGRGGKTLIWAEVIEQPSYPNREADSSSEAYSGRGWYTCRLTSDTTAAWADNTVYIAGDIRIWTLAEGGDDGKYIVLASHTSDKQAGIMPASGLWEKSEEIRVEYALGHDNDDIDIRDCVPWIEVSEIVPVTSSSHSGSTRYYFRQTLIYGGNQIDSTLRYNPEKNRTQAVFK